MQGGEKAAGYFHSILVCLTTWSDPIRSFSEHSLNASYVPDTVPGAQEILPVLKKRTVGHGNEQLQQRMSGSVILTRAPLVQT